MPDFQLRREETDIDFLVRNRFDGCVSSCGSVLGGADADGDDLAEYGSPDRRPSRLWQSSVDGDDVAESSAAVRRQSQILSNWVARQAEEMITNIERRNRESELMALAGLHTVSTLDSSFLRESRRSPSSVDRPVASRASTIFQMWRQLEDMSRARERGSSTDRTTSESRIANESVDNGYGQWDGEPLRTGDTAANLQDGADGSSSREQSPDLGDAERERVRQIVRTWMDEERARESSAQELSPRNGSPRSEWLGETERERVRLVREWVQMASQQRDARASRMAEADQNHDHNVSSIDHQVDHTGRTTLRIRGRQAHLDLVARMARERQMELQGLSEARAVSGFPYRSRIQSLLRGRFLRNGRSVEDDRSASVAARELGQLGQRNSVTGLREGFRFMLENTATGQHSSLVENSSSLNMQNRSDQSHMSNSVDLSSDHESVSRNEASDNLQGIDTLTQLESDRSSDEMDWQESANQTEIWQEDVLALGRQEWQQSTEGGLNEWHDGVEEESNGNWLQSSEQGWYHRTPVDGVDHHLPEVDDWHDNDSQVTVDNWIDGLSTLPSPPPPPPPPPPQSQYDNASNRVSGFIPSDDDNMYSVEIRELLSRRSVSNLLRSGFRESLDRLIRSYVERQVHSPLDWDVQQNSPSPDSMEEELDQQRDNSIEDQHDSVVGPSSTIPSPPVPPRQPLWQSIMHHNNWSRQTIHHNDIEWNVISDLRAELSRLQQGMSNMQRMLEACMDMQLELQRSVRQEVSAALNRSLGKGMCEEWSDDGSKWTNVKNGTCCVCCDGHIDSLLYRCGHMCTCSKCANELVRSGGKCPLCRAPIVEVIRAYSIL